MPGIMRGCEMKRLRIRTILLACWLVLFFSIERIFSPIEVRNIAYFLVWILVLIILVAPRILRIPFWILLSLPVVSFLLVKVVKGDFHSNIASIYSLIEIFSIIMTILLAYWMSLSISEFESAIMKITIGHRDRIPEPDSIGRGLLYREVRRARNHQRPMALLSLAIDEKSLEGEYDRLIQEAQLAIKKQYRLSVVSKILCAELDDCAIIVENNNQFLIALPETNPEEVPIIIERLRRQVAKQAAVNLLIGTSTMPKDSYIFEGLVDKAIEDMNANALEQIPDDLHRLPVDEPITQRSS